MIKVKNDAKVLCFTIKRPISKKNNMATTKGNGAIYASPEVVQAQNAIKVAAKVAAEHLGWRHKGEPLSLRLSWDPATDRVCVEVEKMESYVKNPRRFDLQNLFDIICDSLQVSGVIANDKDFIELSVSERLPPSFGVF